MPESFLDQAWRRLKPSDIWRMDHLRDLLTEPDSPRRHADIHLTLDELSPAGVEYVTLLLAEIKRDKAGGAK